MIWINQIRIYFIDTDYGKDKNIFRGEGRARIRESREKRNFPGELLHMKETGVLIGNFEFPRKETNLGVVQAVSDPFMRPSSNLI